MNDEYILRIFWIHSQDHIDDRTMSIGREFGVDVNSDVERLMNIIEKLLEGFSIIKKATSYGIVLDNIKNYIIQQIRIAAK